MGTDGAVSSQATTAVVGHDLDDDPGEAGRRELLQDPATIAADWWMTQLVCGGTRLSDLVNDDTDVDSRSAVAFREALVMCFAEQLHVNRHQRPWRIEWDREGPHPTLVRLARQAGLRLACSGQAAMELSYCADIVKVRILTPSTDGWEQLFSADIGYRGYVSVRTGSVAVTS